MVQPDEKKKNTDDRHHRAAILEAIPRPVMSGLRQKLQTHLMYDGADEHNPAMIRTSMIKTCKDVYDLLESVNLANTPSQCSGIVIRRNHEKYDALAALLAKRSWDPLMFFGFFQVLVLDQKDGQGSFWIAPQNGANIVHLCKARFHMENVA